MDKNDIINYVMHTPHNTNKAVLSDMLNQLTEGGGSSDFSTATVTVINNASNDTDLMNAIIIGDDSLNSHMIINKDETLPVPAVLYKNEARWGVREYAVAVTGNATATIITTIPTTTTEILITGDCTITITSQTVI